MNNKRPQKETLISQTKRRMLNWLIDEQIEPGAKLPSRRDFAFKFKVGEITITSVLNALADAGIVRKTPSRGTYLQSPPRRPVLIDAYLPMYWRERILTNDIMHHSYFLYRNYLDGLMIAASEFDAAITIEYVERENLKAFATARQTLTRDAAIYFIMDNQEFFEELRERNSLYAQISSGVSKNINQIGRNYDLAADTALTKLKDRGCQTVGFIDYPIGQGGEEENMRGIKKKIEEHGFITIPGSHFHFTPYIDYETSVKNAADFIQSLKDLPDCFVTGTSFELRAFLEAAERLSIDMKDIWFYCFGSQLAEKRPGYNIIFTETPFFKQSYETVKKLVQCVKQDETTFPGFNVNAEKIVEY